jgi:tyrosine-protein kinase Etk/Wzc
MKVSDNLDSNVETKKHFLDYIMIVLKWRRFIAINVATIFVVAIIISLLLPKWYKATASILPPSQPDIFGTLGGGSASLRSIAGIGKIGGMGQRSSAYNYLAILNSRSAMEAVVNKFNLKAVYEISDSSMEKTVKLLQDNVEFDEQKDDYFTISVQDRDPVRSAEIANYFVEILNSISTRLGTQEGKNHREFVEHRLQESKEELKRNEDALREYQEKSGMMLSSEANASISEIASLYGLKTKKEIEFAIAQRSTTADNPQLQQLRIELAELNKKLAKMPQTGITSFRLYRDVAIQQRIVEYLVPVYEQAKIDEEKNIPVVLLLDKAIPPEKKSKPKRAIIVLGAAISAFLFSLFLVFIRERIALMIASDSRQAARINDIRLSISTFFRSKH